MRRDRVENTVARDSPDRELGAGVQGNPFGQLPTPGSDNPRWDMPVDLRQHPTLHIVAPVDPLADPIDWSHYIASRMDAYQHAL